MKILFVNPPFYLYGAISGHGGHLPPLNILYIASYLREKNPGLDIKALDADARQLTLEQTVDEVARFQPDILGITANTCAFTHVMHLCQSVKQCLPSCRIVIGGPHVSALPEMALEQSQADFGVMGEGEATFHELVDAIHKNAENYSQIQGLVWRDQDRNSIRNENRPLIMDLDSIPYPALDLVDCTLYEAAPTKRVASGFNAMICTSRGCPHNCGFCGAQAIWTRRVRKRSPENILNEIYWLRTQFGAQSLNICDEFFTADLERVRLICHGMIERGLVMPWICMARAERLDEETLCLMRDAGCREISFGIESGNPDILKRIDKNLDLHKAEEAIRLVKKAGIKTHASYIIGYLDETPQTIRDTINFAKKLNTSIAAFFVASPLPGTRFYNEAKERGLLKKDVMWEQYSPLSNSESVINLPGLPANEIRRLHRRAIREYYMRPSYILSRLANIRHRYEVKNLLNGVRLLFSIR